MTKQQILIEMWQLLMPDNMVNTMDQEKQTQVWKDTATALFHLLLGMMWGTDLTVAKIEELKELVNKKEKKS